MKLFNFIMPENMPIVDKDNLNNVKPEYFDIEETSETRQVVLHHLTNSIDVQGISRYCNKLKNQHRVLSTQIIMLILQKQNLCEQHLQIISEVQKNLSDTVEVCKKCRSSLNLTSSEVIFSSLKILYYFRKRKVIGNILKMLYNIRKVCRVMERIQQMLVDRNYPKLVSSILEFQKATENQKQYFCMIALHQNLNDLLEQVETNLDMSLSNISTNFDISTYASIFTTYQLLGKSQAAIDQLHMHFIAAVHNSSLACILKYAKTDTGKQFSTVCKFIPLSCFIPCLLELCRSLSNILKTYCLLVNWHNEQENVVKFNEVNNKLSVMNQQYISQILENGVNKICCDIRVKIKTYLDGFELKSLKIEEFLRALIIIEGVSKSEPFVQKNEEDELHKYAKKKFLEYLHIYHASQLDELKTYLENDGWAICPIKSALNIHDLDVNHLSGLKTTFSKVECNPYICDNTESSSYFSDDNLEVMSQRNVLENLEGTPTYQFSEDSDDGDVEDILDHKNKNLKDTLKISNKNSGPIITNTTLGFLKVCTKYVQAIKFLDEESNIVLLYIRQLFELYFYGVHSFFVSDLVKSDFGAVYSTNLKRTISHIKDNLILDEAFRNDKSMLNHRIRQPQLSPTVDLTDASTSFALEERIVAAESLIYFGLQLEAMRHHFNSLLSDDSSQQWLDKFYSQTVNSAVDMRKPIFTATVSKLFELSDFLPLINNVDWEQKDVVCQHSYYIDVLYKKIFQLKQKLKEIQHRVPFNTDTMVTLWDCVAYVSAHLLVDAFSTVKKCSNGGRALMQLDFTQFVTKYETITSVRPMPHQSYVASYIKAYYLPELSVETWIKEHPEYTSKHLMGLFSCMTMNKKLKQKLSALIEDMQRQE